MSIIEPKIGEIFSLHGIKVKTCLMEDGEYCSNCAFAYYDCDNVACIPIDREDAARVIFKEIKEMEVKIQIPDNCELIKDGDTYIVKEKKQCPPRTWKEFCEKNPIKEGEYFIHTLSDIIGVDISDGRSRNCDTDKNILTCKEDAEAFLALMQLRQLRKAWVGNWEPNKDSSYGAVYKIVESSSVWNSALTFPTEYMAKDFLECFKDLCETAKILL